MPVLLHFSDILELFSSVGKSTRILVIEIRRPLLYSCAKLAVLLRKLRQNVVWGALELSRF